MKSYIQNGYKSTKKGTTVKKVGNDYYLYKRTSKRVPDKKYPQPVDTYIGMFTPDGIIEKNFDYNYIC